jgi:para-nitrobenzyl esterase
MAALISDWFFRIPAVRVAEARAASGTSRTWMYRFDQPEPRDNHQLGACHGAEIPFVFGTVAQEQVRPRIGDTPSQAVADQVHRAWVDFIAEGQPGWTPYDTTGRTTALFGQTMTVADDPAGDERFNWAGIR